MITAIRYIILVFIVWLGQLFHASAPVSSVSTKNNLSNTTAVAYSNKPDSIAGKSVTHNNTACTAMAHSIAPFNTAGQHCLAQHNSKMKKLHHCCYCITSPLITDTLIGDPLTKKPVKGHS